MFNTPRTKKVKRHLLWLIVGVVIGGCYGAYDIGYPGPVLIEEEPPSPRDEKVPPRPYEDSVWIPGRWTWSGARYEWIPGHYVQPPGRGCYWYPGGYVRRGHYYVYVPGQWVPLDHRPRHRYVHPRGGAPYGGMEKRAPPGRGHLAPPGSDHDSTPKESGRRGAPEAPEPNRE